MLLQEFKEQQAAPPVRKDKSCSCGGLCHIVIKIKAEWSFPRILMPDGFVCVGKEHEVFFTAKSGNFLEIIENTAHISPGSVYCEFSETANTVEAQLFGFLDALLREKVKTGQRQEAIGKSCGGIEHIIIVTRKQLSVSPGEPEYHGEVYPDFRPLTG